MTLTTPTRSKRIAMLLAGTILLAAGAAHARNGGNHSPSGGGQMQPLIKNTIHPIIVGGTKTDKHRDKDDKKHAKHHDKDDKTYSKNHDKDKDKGKGKPVETGKLPPPQTPTPAGVAGISNGVLKSTLPIGNAGITVSSSGPGMITVSNGTKSVTLPGGSVVLSGVKAVTTSGNGVQIVHQPNGDITVAPAAASAPSAPSAPPASVNAATTGGFARTEQAIVNGAAGIAGDFKNLGKAGANEVKDVATDVYHDAKAAGKAIGNTVEDTAKSVKNFIGDLF